MNWLEYIGAGVVSCFFVFAFLVICCLLIHSYKVTHFLIRALKFSNASLWRKIYKTPHFWWNTFWSPPTYMMFGKNPDGSYNHIVYWDKNYKEPEYEEDREEY